MKIFFTASKHGRKTHNEDFETVYETIKNSKYKPELIATTHSSYENIAKEIRAEKGDGKYIYYKSIQRAIYDSDAIIIDNSVESFRLGHEATLALMQKKPVLVLSQDRNLTDEMAYLGLSSAIYNPKDLTKLQFIVDDFLSIVEEKTLSVRFNLFISNSDKKKLSEKAKKLGMTMSEYVRWLVEKD